MSQTFKAQCIGLGIGVLLRVWVYKLSIGSRYYVHNNDSFLTFFYNNSSILHIVTSILPSRKGKSMLVHFLHSKSLAKCTILWSRLLWNIAFIKHPWISMVSVCLLLSVYLLVWLHARSDFIGHGRVSCHYIKKTSRSAEVPGGFKMFPVSPDCAHPPQRPNKPDSLTLCEMVFWMYKSQSLLN